MTSINIITKPLHTKPIKRTIYEWVNIAFNAKDEERTKLLGPDRTCAEWLLRNGAQVKFLQQESYLSDYNKLPDEKVRLQIQEVDATDSSIMHYGFSHFKGCNQIERLILHRCSFLENRAVKELKYLEKSLLYLQISSCHNISQRGLEDIPSLWKLKKFVLFDLPEVKSKVEAVKALEAKLPNCTIIFK